MLFGKRGREFTGISFWLLYVFCAGSAALGASPALKSLSDHALCTVVFTAIAALFCWGFGSSLSTIKFLIYISYAALVSVIALC